MGSVGGSWRVVGPLLHPATVPERDMSTAHVTAESRPTKTAVHSPVVRYENRAIVNPAAGLVEVADDDPATRARAAEYRRRADVRNEGNRQNRSNGEFDA